MVQFLSVVVVALIATGCAALISTMIRGSSESILRAIAGDFNDHHVTLLPLRPRQHAARAPIRVRPNPLRAAA
jgi:hypothetical protein